MTDKLGKKFSVQFEPEVDHFLTDLAKEKGKPKAQLIRELVVEGLLSEKINEVRESFDELLEKQREIFDNSTSTSDLHTKLLVNILSNVTQALFLGRRGVSEVEISEIRNKSEEYVAKVRNLK
jgi:predicted DNA-binding protein